MRLTAVDEQSVRTSLLLLLLGACGCGDRDARLVTLDAGVGADDGCVIRDPAEALQPHTWKVREGDSLRGIARRVYGDESLWKSIRDANAKRVGKDGAVKAGMVLVIPRDGI